MTALWLLVPTRFKLYALIFIIVLLGFLRYRNNAMAAAVLRYSMEVEDADQKRAADIRARVRDSVRSDTDGYRD